MCQRSVDSNEGYPKKLIIGLSNYDEIEKLNLIATASNVPYCNPRNLIGEHINLQNKITADIMEESQTKTIIAYFKGPDFTKTQWQARKNKLVTFSVTGMKENRLVKVDQEWFNDASAMLNPLLSLVYNAIVRNGYKKILFSGHGVGGAYATITGLLYAIVNLLRMVKFPINLLDGSVDFSIGTLGQPRVGNIMFARMMNEIVKVRRITRYDDYFPHFPPIENQSTIMQHHEREIWIGPDDCDCSQNTNEALWDCRKLEENKEKRLAKLQQFIQEKFWIPGDDLAMENKVCNAGQPITDSSRDNHFGPYFGLTMGDCKNFF
ncbi:hypothetical protein G9A89_001453 [Geosiphon pyriformis]|nr:hypothetical protein G9A89_001453 [Geosiphon pyriformis]